MIIINVYSMMIEYHYNNICISLGPILAHCAISASFQTDNYRTNVLGGDGGGGHHGERANRDEDQE